MLPTANSRFTSDVSPPPLYDRRHSRTSSLHSPRSDRVSTSGRGRSRRFLPLVIRRIFRFPQMDFEFALWEMLYLCISPRRVYRNIYYHKQTKNQWARDDPAFMVILSFLLCVSAVAYGVAYGHGMMGILRMMLYMVFVDFVCIGFVIATASWTFANRFLTHHSVHSVEQSVEWAYAFDVHCNSFFPLFLVTYVLQFFFMPVLLAESAGWISLFLGNTLYALAIGYYTYITFLGYNALPFLLHTEMFLYPIAILAVLYAISLFGFNVSANLLKMYFGR